jgi:hypothetical protein
MKFKTRKADCNRLSYKKEFRYNDGIKYTVKKVKLSLCF